MKNKDTTYSFHADIIRLIAGIGVITIHTTVPFLNYPPFFSSPTFWVANILESLSRISVPLFVLVSGYLLLRVDKNYPLKTFMKKRLLRIGIPILIWPFFYLLWRMYFIHDTINFRMLPDIFIKMTIYYHLYFLYLILGIYLVAPILKIYNDNANVSNKKYFLSFSFILFILLTFLSYFGLPGGLAFSSIFTFFIPYIPYFLAGSYFGNIQLTKVKQQLGAALFFILVLVTAILNWNYMKYVGWNNQLITGGNLSRYFYDYLSPNVVIMSLLAFTVMLNSSFHAKFFNPKIIQLVKELSAATFGVYLLHPMVLDVLDTSSFLNLQHIHSPVWGFLIVKIILVILFSYLLVLIAKKTPLKFLFG